MIVAVPVPDTLSPSLRLPPEQLGQELLMLAAVKLFEMTSLSAGAAAELAGLPKAVFLQQLSRYGVPVFQQTGSELQAEVDHA